MAVKKTDRRQQVRRQRNERSVSIWRRAIDSIGLIPLLAGLVFAAVATAVALQGSHTRHGNLGQKLYQPIYAEVTFEVEDDAGTLRRQQASRAATPSHYRLNHQLIAKVGTELQELYQAAQASETLDAFIAAAETRVWTVDEDAYLQLRSYAADQTQVRFESGIARLRTALKSERTFEANSAAERTPRSTVDVILVHDDDGTIEHGRAAKEVRSLDLVPISNVTSLRRAADYLASFGGFAIALRATVSQILVDRMSDAPLLVFDLAATNEEMLRAEQSVRPATVVYERGRPLIGRNTETGLSAADLQLLARHDAAYVEYVKSNAEGAQALRDRELLRSSGIGAIILLATGGLFIYTGMYQRRVFEVNTRVVAIVLLLLGTLIVTKLIDARILHRELIHIPAVFAASVLAITYTRRFAVGAMAFVGVMIVLSVRGDAAMLITMMIGVASVVHLLNEIRTRTRLLLVSAMCSAAMFVAATGFELVDGQALKFAARSGGWAAAGGFLAVMLLQATLPLIERVFRIATSLTLLEWRDPTKPLLQRLAREAPGTYTHSLALSEMAAGACEAIGANGLLTQVAALYHDVGKLHKPEYFVENQEAQINRHDKLEPTMSLLIIIGHVKDGMEMAREYNLPRVLHPFVEEHHGTTVVRYFHHIASEKQPQIASGKHDREVPDVRFRYPGPKPKSRESAVLMICDGSEGAVRALSEPTPGRIEQVVHQIVTHRLNDGQFDDCDITLRELHRVEDSLVKSLSSHYHGRVAYPKREKQENGGEAEAKSIAG